MSYILTEFEGNPYTWHIRLHQRITIPTPEGVQNIETWVLYNKDEIQSSPTSKRFAQQYCDEALLKITI